MNHSDPIEPSMEAPDVLSPPVLRPEAKAYRVVFRGNASEYFRIWIVNLALTVVTLGIYGAWAKVRTRQYFFGNTFLDDHPFAYLARPAALLRGMLIVAGASALYYVTATYAAPQYTLFLLGAYMVLMPLVLVLALRFRMHYTSYRGLRFRFNGSYGQSYIAFLLWPIAGILLLTFPWIRHRQARFVLGNIGYGSSRAEFSAESKEFFSIYLSVLGLVFVFGIAMVMMNIALMLMGFSQAGASLIASLASVAGAAVLRAYVNVRESNVALSSVAFEGLKLHCDMRVQDMAVLYITNGLAIIASLGLAIPWAMCRVWRYRAEHLSLIGSGELSDFVAAQESQRTSAAADAAFDFGLDF